MQVGKTVFFVLRSWSPKLAKSFAGRGMLVRPVLVYALPRQRIKPTDVASHLYQHSQIATPNPVSGKPHKQMLATPLYSKCTLLTPPPLIPIPVPIPSACHAIPAHYPRHQVVAAQPMAVHTHAAVPFGAHAVALQSQFRSAAPRYPGTIVQPPHMRTMGPPPRGTRALYNAPRK